jgi:hypothetical protein
VGRTVLDGRCSFVFIANIVIKMQGAETKVDEFTERMRCMSLAFYFVH